jgi:hypothetical protein
MLGMEMNKQLLFPAIMIKVIVEEKMLINALHLEDWVRRSCPTYNLVSSPFIKNVNWVQRSVLL